MTNVTIKGIFGKTSTDVATVYAKVARGQIIALYANPERNKQN